MDVLSYRGELLFPFFPSDCLFEDITDFKRDLAHWLIFHRLFCLKVECFAAFFHHAGVKGAETEKIELLSLRKLVLHPP